MPQHVSHHFSPITLYYICQLFLLLYWAQHVCFEILNILLLSVSLHISTKVNIVRIKEVWIPLQVTHGNPPTHSSHSHMPITKSSCHIHLQIMPHQIMFKDHGVDYLIVQFWICLYKVYKLSLIWFVKVVILHRFFSQYTVNIIFLL